ncbi:hypothetical protein JAAARDRAFT_125682 [Jaapia argillacea MUCL 33604]|uniref:RNA helicase n=1 Tax=Jaapia argillacea MUCL 33604 TaxID=933084 RepID=A0A067Q926_9AGAM|nr:hypothetical protein JAAARDRAFT_125682 [Jaapia argillacea MUCL 33604]
MVGVCHTLVSTGSCPAAGSTCPFHHDIYLCEVCNVVCINASAYQGHLGGKKHRSRALGLGKMYHCPICQKSMAGAQTWAAHIGGKGHRAKAALQGMAAADVQPEEPTEIPGMQYCAPCDLHVRIEQWGSHLRSNLHRKRELFLTHKAILEESEKDKHGVTISHGGDGVDFGIVEPTNAQTGVTTYLSIKTAVPLAKVTLVSANLSSSARDHPSPYVFSISVVGANRGLVYGRELRLLATFRSDFGGRFSTRAELVFEDTSLKQQFIITRTLRAIVGNKADHERLQPIAPYKPKKRTKREEIEESEVVPGEAPPATNAIKYVGKLPVARIPKSIMTAITTGSVEEVVDRVKRTVLPKVFNTANHGRHFQALLWIEELRMERDLQVYDISDATLNRNRQYHFLAVPGLAEKRPSVLVGDQIHFQRIGVGKDKWYEGHVHFVTKAEAGLRFHTSFSAHSPSQRYNVRFKLNRIPLRRQHEALDTALSVDRLFFPQQVHVLSLNPPPPTMRVYNNLIATNPPQVRAVTSILRLKPGSTPFIVFGPPGTGKTVTIVEAIRQILRENPNAKILACAPSNSAADLIASRLAMLSTQELFRFYAPSRSPNTVPTDLEEFAYTKEMAINDGQLGLGQNFEFRRNVHFSAPPMVVLKRFRVIVSTCVSASFAHGVGLPRGHFTHIFVDEAGQATEPEVMVAIRTMADNSTNIVLSGDPKQLGPVIRSPIARELGLEKSYIERLMEGGVYDETAAHSTSVVKLVKNFRSHQAILKFPNERFYRGELQPFADPTVINSFINSPHLVNPKFPIVFHGIRGKDDREASSPSFFNIDEALQVKGYIERLKANRQFRITDAEIGVIAPYHAQCLKIRATLRSVADEVKVGSTEEFQGQERRVIIISTVRSSKEFVEYDLRHTLGFVANPRRFNVAVTRAKALLIIIGDPTVLSLDPLWRSFLNYIHENRGWRGQPPTWDPSAPVRDDGGYDREIRESAVEDMNEFARRMESLTLGNVDGEDGEGADEDVNVDRPWVEVE